MSKDLYSVLGVSKSTDKAGLKAAYRKLARKYHPDVNKDNPAAADKFKEISSAYDILGDDDKRKKYDNKEIDSDGKPTGFGAGFGGGYGGGQNGGYGFSQQGGADFDFSSIFGEDIFSAFTGGGSRRQARQSKGEDISYNMNIDFISAAKGAEQNVNINGKNVNVKIPAGTTNGQTLRLKELGKTGHYGGKNGDVLITLTVAKHPYFSADGLNINIEVPITIKEAILGGKIIIPTLEGSVSMKIPPYTSSGDKLRLKGKGIKNYKGQGDQFVFLKIVSPKDHNSELENLLLQMPDENVRTF